MAREFEVPFLGSVPIDPMFIRLIEEGKRPDYPEGTVVLGQAMANRAQTNGTEHLDTDLLVDKYTSCSLWPVFSGMVDQLRSSIERSSP